MSHEPIIEQRSSDAMFSFMIGLNRIYNILMSFRLINYQTLSKSISTQEENSLQDFIDKLEQSFSNISATLCQQSFTSPQIFNATYIRPDKSLLNTIEIKNAILDQQGLQDDLLFF